MKRVITSISNHADGRGFRLSFEDHLNNACTLPRCLDLVFSVPVGRNTCIGVRTKKIDLGHLGMRNLGDHLDNRPQARAR